MNQLFFAPILALICLPTVALASHSTLFKNAHIVSVATFLNSKQSETRDCEFREVLQCVVGQVHCQKKYLYEGERHRALISLKKKRITFSGHLFASQFEYEELQFDQILDDEGDILVKASSKTTGVFLDIHPEGSWITDWKGSITLSQITATPNNARTRTIFTGTCK